MQTGTYLYSGHEAWLHSVYISAMSEGNILGLSNDSLIIDMTAFTTPPTEEQMDALLAEYLEMKEQGAIYYNAGNVIVDSETGKIYKWSVKVANGTPTLHVEEIE